MLMASRNHEILVIEVITNNYLVEKVYISTGNSVDVIYYWTFQKMGLKDNQLTPVRTHLVRFRGHIVYPEGMISLIITIGKSPKSRTIQVNFNVVKADMPYNMLFGRLILNALVRYSPHIT